MDRFSPSSMRLLAIQLKRIGDLILTIPALRAVKLARPESRITLALTGGAADLIPALDECVDEALVYGARGQNEVLWGRIIRDGFDACADFTGRDRSALMALASRAAQRVVARNALRKNGFWRKLCYTAFADSPVRERHTVDHYLDCLAPLGILPANAQPRPGPALRLPPETVSRARQILGSHGLAADCFVVIHPGSARAEKYWLPERWAEVIDFCQRELGLPCVLTGGRGDAFEQTHLAKIHAALYAPCVDFSGQLDLLTLAAVLAEARLFVGVDSGPMHLAATWQKPQIVLFGPTNPFHWRPRHPGCRVLQPGCDQPLNESEFQAHSQGRPMEGISTQAVIGCIKREIPAR